MCYFFANQIVFIIISFPPSCSQFAHGVRSGPNRCLFLDGSLWLGSFICYRSLESWLSWRASQPLSFWAFHLSASFFGAQRHVCKVSRLLALSSYLSSAQQFVAIQGQYEALLTHQSLSRLYLVWFSLPSSLYFPRIFADRSKSLKDHEADRLQLS